MILGPVTFQLPPEIMEKLFIEKIYRLKRLNKLKKTIIILSIIFWSIWIWAGRNGVVLTFSIIFTIFNYALYSYPRHLARKAAKKIEGVSSPQTWLFESKKFTVTNSEGTVISFNWNKIKSIFNDKNYMYLQDHDGDVHPFPLNIIGLNNMQVITKIWQDSLKNPA